MDYTRKVGSLILTSLLEDLGKGWAAVRPHSASGAVSGVKPELMVGTTWCRNAELGVGSKAWAGRPGQKADP